MFIKYNAPIAPSKIKNGYSITKENYFSLKYNIPTDINAPYSNNDIVEYKDPGKNVSDAWNFDIKHAIPAPTPPIAQGTGIKLSDAKDYVILFWTHYTPSETNLDGH